MSAAHRGAYHVPRQNLSISLRRIPARPASRMLLVRDPR